MLYVYGYPHQLAFPDTSAPALVTHNHARFRAGQESFGQEERILVSTDALLGFK
jgi:hypothetical protein